MIEGGFPMSRYPDWVNAHKTKGTSVKKVGESYYLYASTSQRVEGKKYPQPIQKFIGTITPNGVVKSNMRKISTERVRVFEYGFSFAMKHLLPQKFLTDIRDREKGNDAFLNIVRHFSPASYLLRDIHVPSLEALHMSLCTQVKKFERLIGVAINDLLPLTGLYLVETQEMDLLSVATPQMLEIFSKIGVDRYDLPA
jgi:hypothetical protein